MTRRNRHLFISLAMLGMLGPAAAPADDGAGLTSLNRLVRHFDFEDAELAPYEMPVNFYRYGADEGGVAQGFPPFGTMTLTNSVSHTGRWSFMFDLDGGSMAARVPSAVIPVMPGADYHVAVRVRTEGLTHARARLVAWLYDESGRIIPESRTESPPVHTEGRWETLSVPVFGRYTAAADLGIELQLLQPSQAGNRQSALRNRLPAGPQPTADSRQPTAQRFAPTLMDVSGRAYFDDLSVWQQPRITLSTSHLGNVIVAPHQPQITVSVHDVVHESLEARLHIFDVDGNAVFEAQFAAPRSPRQRMIDLPLDRFGWYRASLDILVAGELAARQWLDFTYLSPPHRTEIASQNGFTLALRESWQDHAIRLADGRESLPDLIQKLGVTSVTLPVLHRRMSRQTMKDYYEQARSMIERLRSDDTDLTFSLESVPNDLSDELDIAADEVLVALDREPRIWRDYLDDLIVNFGFEVPRWQFGSTGGDEVFWQHNAASLVERVTESLRRLVPGATVLLPAKALHQLRPTAGGTGSHIALPYHVRPQAIQDYVEQWLAEQRAGASGASTEDAAANSPDEIGAEMIFDIEPMPRGMYSQRDRAADLMLRVLHAWRAGADHVSFRPPWTPVQPAAAGNPHSSDSGYVTFGSPQIGASAAGANCSPPHDCRARDVMPDETFGVWSVLIDQLRGRRVVGTLPIGQGRHCWLLAGVDRDDAAMVTWHEPGAVQRTFALQLADGPVVETDPYGNRRVIPLRSGLHEIELGRMPHFIEGINLELVQFRGGFALDPPFIPVEARVHEHELILRNPWDMPIGGTLRLRESEGLTISPRAHRFTIPARGEVRLPVGIQIDRGVIAGTKRVEADVSLTSDGQYELYLFSEVSVGLRHLEFSATSRIERNAETGDHDLVVTQYITNTGRRTMNVEAFLIGPGLRHERRLISMLNPGEMAIRVFTVPNGAITHAGKQIRVGVIERDGVGRLNQIIHVPER